MNINSDVLKIKNKIIETRRDIHKHPELSFQEYRTSELVAKQLEQFGISVECNIGKTGVVGTLKGADSGKTIAFRADMDALPIQETGDAPYKSVNDGVMHACGHDAHTAMLLGAAEVLSKNHTNISGTIKFIFQPAEEGYAGAKFMIEDGAIDNVDEIYGLHVWNYQKSGTVGVQSGAVMAAADIFTITIRGIGGHGATPQGTVDCVVVSSHLIQALQTIVSRNTNPLENTVVTVGQINGGYNFNIIADKIVLKGTTRAYTEDNRDLIKRRMKEIIQGTEKMFGAKIQLDYKDGYPPVINDITVTNNLYNIAKSIVGENVISPYLSMGGEDFSYFANKVPGCFFFLGTAPKDREPMSTPQHCSHFDIDENAMLIGTSIFVQTALENV
jgi:amidohydrolase